MINIMIPVSINENYLFKYDTNNSYYNDICHTYTTLNNTDIAPPRMLIAFLENNLQEDGTVLIPEVLRPYMGGKDKLIPNEKK